MLALALLPAFAGAALAGEPGTYFLDAFSCAVSDEEGNVLDENVIPAGSELVIWEGWLALKRGQVQGFINNAEWVLTVNGESVDVEPLLGGVIPFGPYWADLFFYSAGTLDSGDVVETHFDNVLKSASFDGFVHWGRGSVYGGGVDCTVTAD